MAQEAERSIVQQLYDSLDARKRPEDVAELVLRLLGKSLSSSERRKLDKAVKRSLKRSAWQFTSMLQDFLRPKGPVRQTRKARELFETAGVISEGECADPEKVEAFIRKISPEIRKAYGKNDYKSDRIDRAARKLAGLDISKRRYNKLFRLLQRLERKLEVLKRELKKREITLIGQSGFASKLARNEFASNRNSAAFIAYYSARCKLRSQFTISGQTRPFDTIAEMLYHRCLKDPDANWWAIAHVYPEQAVLNKLTEEQSGELLGRWYGVLEEIAKLLKTVWSENSFRRESMVVKKGDDSTTWNSMANAWNRARSNWIALVYSMRISYLLDHLLPGKVLRLMAADVAAWHRSAGGDLDPDTKVWAELPLPWDVIEGKAPCDRVVIEEVCSRHKVDPRKRGWVAPHAPSKTFEFTPTPELVHGVSVGSPKLARIMKKANWFSGKRKAKPVESDERFAVNSDEHGFVTGVEVDDPAE